MDDFPSVFKCDRRTIILKIASAELHVVFNDGIKTFAGSHWLDKKDEIGEDKLLQRKSNANCAACSHAPTKYRTKKCSRVAKVFVEAAQKRRRLCLYAEKVVSTKKPALDTKNLEGILASTKKTLPLSFECSDIENWQNYLLKWNFLNFCPSRIQFKDTKLHVFQSRSRLNVLHHGIRLWWMSSRPFFWEKFVEISKYVGASSFFSRILSCRVSERVVGNGNLGFRQKANFCQLVGFRLTKKPSKDTLMNI